MVNGYMDPLALCDRDIPVARDDRRPGTLWTALAFTVGDIAVQKVQETFFEVPPIQSARARIQESLYEMDD